MRTSSPARRHAPKTHAEASARAARHRLRRGDGRGAADPLRGRAGRDGGARPGAQAAGAGPVGGGRPRVAWRRRRTKGGFSRAAKAKLTRAARPGRPGGAAAASRAALAAWALRAGRRRLPRASRRPPRRSRPGKAAWLIEASRRRRRTAGASSCAVAPTSRRPATVSGCFLRDELGLALGLGNVIHTAFLAGRGAERWTQDVERLSGFRPLLPESWREEPSGGRGRI